ncbi:MAG TPA: hypothetical protein VM597_28595 [Gemmataceae bacterium]|jgi:hypothetical protein|nr:hypothetical protein [Gemmataceae bacterium]
MLNAERPKDWTAPVDYRNGTVHIRAEVLEKPEGGAPTTWTLCYIPSTGSPCRPTAAKMSAGCLQ